MEKQNLNTTNEWITSDEAAEITGYSSRQIYKLDEIGRIRTIKNPNGKRKLYNKKDLLQYKAAHPKKTMKNTVWDEIDFIPGEYFYPLFGYDCKYFISNKQRVINCSNGQILTPQPQKDIEKKETGYMMVELLKDGNPKGVFLHKLVVMTQVDNVLKKIEIHHIDCNRSNNKKENLLPVWHRQHTELHRLLNEGKTKEYNELVKQIKKENKQKVYIIPHPDFEEDENFCYYMYLSKDAYKSFSKSGNIPHGGILKETAELKKNGSENKKGWLYGYNSNW